jgi:lipopolysaccharide transport system ATP-binding protein
MSELAIRVEGLAKRYRIGRVKEGTTTLREAITRTTGDVARTLFSKVRRANRERRRPSETIWALQDINFDIPRGETFGIIGGNGAGKSTLLKILSRITEPTNGNAFIHGRVGSLLEVGTGFHSELTGRENIYLNGAILGMKRRQIISKFDEIVAFAGVEQFIDTPVKRYSSGMYLRLAFAVAAHLEPEILIVDEVLAVGDMQFQRKCLGKMEEVSMRQGRTILFVTHNLEAIRRLCTRSILLDRGRLVADGPTEDVIAKYVDESRSCAPAGKWNDVSHCARVGTGDARFSSIRFFSDSDRASGQPYPDGPLEFELVIEAKSTISVQSIAIGLRDGAGRRLVNADTELLLPAIDIRCGRNLVRLRIDSVHLKPGKYGIALWLARHSGGGMSQHEVLDYIEKAYELEIVDAIRAAPPGSSRSAGFVTCAFKLLEVTCIEEPGPPFQSSR